MRDITQFWNQTQILERFELLWEYRYELWVMSLSYGFWDMSFEIWAMSNPNRP